MLHNDYLLDFIGKTKIKNVQDDLRKLANEQNCKKNYSLPMSIVDISPDNCYSALGMSVPNDIICDNFGRYLLGIIGRLNVITDLTDDDGSLHTRNFNNSNMELCFNNSRYFMFPTTVTVTCGSSFRLGSGDTEPERADFTIETLLPDTPESLYQQTLEGNLSVINGTVTLAKTYPSALGSGTIREIGYFQSLGLFSDVPPSIRCMFTHDLILPVVPYVAGQVINFEMVFQT